MYISLFHFFTRKHKYRYIKTEWASQTTLILSQRIFRLYSLGSIWTRCSK